MGKSTLILYKSQTGFTKKYAEMIAKETSGKAMNLKEGTPGLLSSFDMVLFGGRMRAGRIDGLADARRLFQKGSTKPAALFVTGAMPNTEKQAIEEMWKNNLTSEELANLPHFYMQSGLCYENMNLLEKSMMKMLLFVLKHKKNKTSDEIRLVEMIACSYDISSEEYIRPLVEHLQKN